MAKTVVGLFDNVDQANEVSNDLVNNGFSQDDISVIANAETAKELGKGTKTTEGGGAGKGAAAGAGIGAVAGGAAGLLAAAAGLTVPGIGPAIAAGPLAAALGGAGAGAVGGGLIGALVSAGVPQDEAEHYAEGVRRGGALVTVNSSDEMADTAADIMKRHGAADIDQRAGEWRKRGWTGFQPEAQPLTRAELEKEREAIPVVEEEVKVGKREVGRGGVRVYSQVKERPVEEELHLREEHAKVERHPVDRPISAGDEAFKERTIEVRETGEEPVVSKESRIVEEVSVGKEAEERTETIRERERYTDIEVQSLGGRERAASEEDFNLYGADFRTHFAKKYGAERGNYDDYEDAYRFGFDLSHSGRFGNRDWDQIEADASSEWERHNPGTWDQFKDAVRFGWARERGAHYTGPERRKQPRGNVLRM